MNMLPLLTPNRTDTQAEIELIQKLAKEAGAFDSIACFHWAEGGQGAVLLASAVERACNLPSNFKFLYASEVWDPNFFE